MASCAASEVLRRVGCGDYEPRKNRVVDQSHLTATPPSFEKCDRDDIVRILRARDQSKAMASDTIPVTVEEDTESFTVALERQGPRRRVVRICAHIPYCPAPSTLLQGFP